MGTRRLGALRRRIIWGGSSLRANTGDYYRKNILFPFFEQYLKGNGDAKLPKAYVFETGHERVETIFRVASERG